MPLLGLISHSNGAREDLRSLQWAGKEGEQLTAPSKVDLHYTHQMCDNCLRSTSSNDLLRYIEYMVNTHFWLLWRVLKGRSCQQIEQISMQCCSWLFSDRRMMWVRGLAALPDHVLQLANHVCLRGVHWRHVYTKGGYDITTENHSLVAFIYFINTDSTWSTQTTDSMWAFMCTV